MILIWILIQLLIGYNLVFSFLLYLFSLLKRRKSNAVILNENYDYGIIVTAYEQTHMLPAVVDSLLKIKYNNYHIYIVADNCDISTLQILNSRVSVLKPEMILSNNVKSHFYAINRFNRNHDILTIIDSDNLVHPEYINELNKFFAQGFKAVQGRRKAKNLETQLACLDAARDNYYNFYDSEVLFRLGSSSTLSGSGMAFKTNVYVECLESVEVLGAGFDKVLQAQLVEKGYRIAYAPEAIVFDEKTTHSKQLIGQRSRWINTWFKYVKYGFRLILTGIKRKSLNQFLFGTILLRPPLFIFILLSVICFCLNLFINNFYSVVWLIAFIIFVFSFLFALKKQDTSKKVYSSLGSIPKFIFYQLVSLYYARIANQRSIATKRPNISKIEYDKW